MKQTDNFIKEIYNTYPQLKAIVQEIAAQGGTVFAVGGAIRDYFLDKPIKDLDIEVHNLSLQQLSKLLSAFGVVDYVGKSFGVLKLHGLPFDFALPRSDSAGRKPAVVIDPAMSIEDAFKRRDLTINAMGINLVMGQLVDPFNGLGDLQRGVLQAPQAQFFVQDPLRFFRVMQFISRFGMRPTQELNELCAGMDISKVAQERIEQEFFKMLLKSPQPSLGLRWLQQIGRLQDILPELFATVGVQQNPKWHPEGDVFEHSMQALDEAAQLPVADEHDRLILLLATICHDLGKVTKTFVKDGEIHSYGHELDSAVFAKQMLKRITNQKDLIHTVSLLCKYHMRPLGFEKNDAKAPAYKKLALLLAPYTTLRMLSNVCIADRLGRQPLDKKIAISLQPVQHFIAQAQRYGVLDGIEEPVLKGRDLLDIVEAGPRLGALVKKAYEIQIEEGIHNKEELKKRVVGKK